MSIRLITPLNILAFTASCLYAQDTTLADDLKKQIPTNLEGVENALELGKKAVQPLVSDSARQKRLKEMHQRAMLVVKRNADFKKLVTEGKVHPWGEIAERYPAMQDSLDRFTSDYQKLLSEEDPVKRSQLESALVLAIQPFGPYLRAADPVYLDRSLTAEQVTELKQLSETDREPDADAKHALTHLSPSASYTLLNITTPLKVSAVPNSIVYFSTDGGGMFSNGITRQKVIANSQGIAETTWISKGDSVGFNVVSVTSPQSNSTLSFEVEVVQLKLRALPKLPVIAKQLSALKNTALQQAKQSQEHLASPTEFSDPEESLISEGLLNAPQTP